jgi:hypothetical protein
LPAIPPDPNHYREGQRRYAKPYTKTHANVNPTPKITGKISPNFGGKNTQFWEKVIHISGWRKHHISGEKAPHIEKKRLHKSRHYLDLERSPKPAEVLEL